MNPIDTPTRMPAWLEQAWLGRYLDRQLSGDEAAWFEAYSLDKADLLDMIETDTHLRAALATAARPAQTDVMAETVAFVHPGRSGNEPRTQNRSWLALAATLVLGVCVGSFALRWSGLERGGEYASPTRVVYDTMRGESSSPRIEHADSKSPYILVEVAVPPSAEDILLHSDGRADLALSASPDGFVSFLLDRDEEKATHSISYHLADDKTIRKIALPYPGGEH